MPWTIQKLLNWATDYFRKKGIDSARLDAELLLAHVLSLERVQLYTQFDRPLQEKELQVFKELLQRRSAREPLAYILGEKEFYSLRFKVGPGVLVPRPETEELVDRGLAHLEGWKGQDLRILDLATGNGCVLITLLNKIPEAQGIGVDLSDPALELAAMNAKKHGVESRTQWILQDLSEEWSHELAGPFDLITANLPYIGEEEYPSLQPEIQKYEPKAALVPGPKGIESFQWVLPRLRSRLKQGAAAFLEMGADQGEALIQLAQELAPELKPHILPDLAGRDRLLALQ